MTYRPFTPTDWENDPSTATPIDEVALERIENALGEVDTDLASAETSVALNNTHRGNTANPHSVTAAQVGAKQVLIRAAGGLATITDATATDATLYKQHIVWAGASFGETVWVDLSIMFRWQDLPASDILNLAPAVCLTPSGGSSTVLEVPSSSMFLKWDTDAQYVSGHLRCFAAGLVQSDIEVGSAQNGLSIGLRGYFDTDNTGRGANALKYVARITAQ